MKSQESLSSIQDLKTGLTPNDAYVKTHGKGVVRMQLKVSAFQVQLFNLLNRPVCSSHHSFYLICQLTVYMKYSCYLLKCILHPRPSCLIVFY
jgi:hypothetical protein